VLLGADPVRSSAVHSRWRALRRSRSPAGATTPVAQASGSAYRGVIAGARFIGDRAPMLSALLRTAARAVAALSLTGGMAAAGAQEPGPQAARRIPPALLKLLIEHPLATRHLPPGPLQISNSLLEPGLVPSRFGQRVELVSDSEAERNGCLRFRSFDVRGSSATVVAEYRPARVALQFELAVSAGGWWRIVSAVARPE